MAGGLWSNRQAWPTFSSDGAIGCALALPRHSPRSVKGSQSGHLEGSHNAAGAVDQPQGEAGVFASPDPSRRQSCNRAEPDAPRMGVPRPIAARTISARLPITVRNTQPGAAPATRFLTLPNGVIVRARRRMFPYVCDARAGAMPRSIPHPCVSAAIRCRRRSAE